MTKLSKLSLPVTLLRDHLAYGYPSVARPVEIAIEEAFLMKGLGTPLVVVKDDSASIRFHSGHLMQAPLPESVENFIDAVRSRERPETPVRFILDLEKREEAG